MTIDKEIERQARYLAEENRKSEPGITKIFWFPDNDEIRLVSLFEGIPTSEDGTLHPFYFRASPEDQLSASSAVALIKPDEFGKLALPSHWGSWREAIEL